MPDYVGYASVGDCPQCGIKIGPMSLGDVIGEQDGRLVYECKPHFTCDNCGYYIDKFIADKKQGE